MAQTCGVNGSTLLTWKVDKSPYDPREYRYVQLPNSIKALLVSDPTLDKAGAALAVGVGHLSDPSDLPGLAHFTEHMLFLGTKTFPNEAEYRTFLSANSGSSNAYTSMDETCYHFTVHPSALDEALHRHSRFFVEPLFDESCTQREVKAVDSEFRRNLRMDSRRLFQLGKAVSNEDAVYHKFGTGNIDTLARDGNRQRMVEWKEEMYCANRMRLSIVSNHSLDDLQELAYKYYADIENKNRPEIIFSGPDGDVLRSGKELGKLVRFETVVDSPLLKIEFPFPDLENARGIATKPGDYLSFLLGHESKGSILYLLKKQGWATGLSAYSSGGSRGFNFYTVSLTVTQSGLENYTQIVALIFSYISLIKRVGVQEWVFKETQELAKLEFEFHEPGTPGRVSTAYASRLLSPYEPEKILSGPYFTPEFDIKFIEECIDILDKGKDGECRVFLGYKDFDPKAPGVKHEKYYETPYLIQDLDLTSFQVDSELKKELAMPAPNKYIPESTELLTQREEWKEKIPKQAPTLIHQSSAGRMFFKQDDLWFIPKGRAKFKIQSPIASSTVEESVKSLLFASYMNEALKDEVYSSQLAGLSGSISYDPEGFEVTLSGFTDKFSLLLEFILKTLVELEVNETRYNLIHERTLKMYKNALLGNPYSITGTFVVHALKDSTYLWSERVATLESVTFEQVIEHGKALLQSGFIQGFAHGNFLKKDALSLYKLVQDNLQLQSFDQALMDFRRGRYLPKNSTVFHRDYNADPENVNSAVEVRYHIKHRSDTKTFNLLRLFAQIAKVPVFSTLRTKEQLGYIVQSGTEDIGGVLGFYVIIQSEYSPEFLYERTAAFWDTFDAFLDKMTEDEFSEHKKALINSRKEKPKNMEGEAQRYWSEIEQSRLDFFRREKDIPDIESLTKEDIVQFFNRYISNKSTERGVFTAIVRSKRFQPTSLEQLKEAITLHLDKESPQIKELDTLIAGKPTLVSLQDFTQKTFKSIPSSVQESLEKLSTLVALPDGSQEVTDTRAFRLSIEKAEKVPEETDYEKDLDSRL